MPKVLEKCVKKVRADGKSESEAYAICAKQTGWVRKEGGGWRNKKTGELYEEYGEYDSFLDMFFESSKSPHSKKSTKGF
jgi:hypothetical protein